MMRKSCLAVALACLLILPATAEDRLSAFPFEDGLWSGTIATPSDGSAFDECRAENTHGDGTTLVLARVAGGPWRLQLSNPVWTFKPGKSNATIAQVDFYPRLEIAVEAVAGTALMVRDIERISLLGLIENGHTIELVSDDFRMKYDLEGSAKVIARLRNCGSGRPG